MILVPADTPGITHRAAADRVRLRRRAARPHGDRLRERARAGLATSCSAKAAASRSRRAASARDASTTACALIGLAERALELMCKRASIARRLRQDRRRADRDAGAHRRGALQDRHGAPADAEGGLDDGHGRQQGRQGRDRDDQGGGAEHGLPGDRLGDAGARRRRHVATTSRWPTPTRSARTLRFADGPDEVHRNAIAKMELGKHAA